MTDNVTPIAPIAQCAGCGATIRHEQRFDPTKHGDECPQPEIRMRRAEARIAQLQEILTQLVGQGNETVTNQVDLNKRLLEANGQIEAMRGVINQYSELVMRLSHSTEIRDILKGKHGSSEAISDTLIEWECPQCGERRLPLSAGGQCWCTAPHRPSLLHSDARPAEPAGTPDAGADAAAGGPAGAEPCS